MRSPSEYAEEHDLTPVARVSGPEWFAEHPEAVEAVKECRAMGWSWGQIKQYLADEAGFPLKDAKSVKWALDA